MVKTIDLPDKLAVDGGVEAMADTCKRRFFFTPAFDIYNGVAGLYDYGPVLTAIKANWISLWRTHFIIEEGMTEVEPTCLTPFEVLKTSGHADRFADVMTKDEKTGECFRLDKFLEDYCDKRLSDPKDKMDAATREKLVHLKNKADGMTPEEMWENVVALDLKSPKGNKLVTPFKFNLMFNINIGPSGDQAGFLRPELAQGIFMNFRKMLDYNNSQMPFAGAAIGQAFRNEIAPRGGLLRVREFTLAEIEHFLNPQNKDHPKFATVADLELPLWPKEHQEEPGPVILMTIGEAVEKKIIDNQTLGYFIGRVFLFLKKCGARHIRFRQHRTKEKAHYAQDCWDAELLNAGGWLECVGIADRACYDLEVHSRKTGQDMSAFEQYPTPIEQEVLQRNLDKKSISQTFKKDSARVFKFLLEELAPDAALALEAELAAKDSAEVAVAEDLKVTLTRPMASFAIVKEKVAGRKYTPSVVEPSFGIGRILYCILEQNYWVRQIEAKADKAAKNEKRAGFSLPAAIAPYKVMICPLMNKPDLVAQVHEIRKSCAAHGLAFKVDDTSVPIGKRYARTDELGVPFCLTVDFQTIEDGTVTIRERDSMQQVRIPVAEIVETIKAVVDGRLSWEAIITKYPTQAATKETDE
eukprot:TRINITY_DN67189_c0_g1_i1.p1 TRINITY_DN67189_c0_g1~~TRINITY_DN67189_c0_g1_i1.p1  ORF type:complete len:639 (-),score=131.11 TRINITY_DN67189_c0_g1_i1:18-1934(-)